MRHIARCLAHASARGATLVLVAATATFLLILGPVPLAANASASARLASAPSTTGTPHFLPIRGKTGNVATNTPNADPGNSDKMTYHHGPVERTNTNYLIFWEPPTLQDGAPTHVSAPYNALIERYFSDVGGTGLYKNNTQYYDTTGAIANNSTLGGVYLDTSPYPASGCQAAPTPDGCLTDTQIQAEVAKAMGANGWTASVGHMFFVYLSYGEGSCTSASTSVCFLTIYCAYHFLFSSAGQEVAYALVPYVGITPTLCGSGFAPNDLDADTAIDDTSHEQMEGVTDPYLSAWFHGGHFQEIGDLCVSLYGPMTFDGGQANQAWGPNGKDYYVMQQEWSNASNSCVQAGP